MRTITQPSGEKFKAANRGDEWFNYTVTQNGDLIVKGNDGYWYYGIAAKNGLEKSKAKVRINARPAQAQTLKNVSNLRKMKLKSINKNYGATVSNRAAASKVSGSRLSSQSTGAASVTGTQKILVILVSFTNVSIVNMDSAWSSEFFGDTGKTLKTYYKETSQNNFYFSPAAETKGTANDGVVRVTLSYAHPNTGEDINQSNINIVTNAITAADAYVNFSTFDTDGNGTISVSELHIITVVAGNDCSYGDSSPCIWPHSWETDANQRKDGKYISGGYTQVAEKQGGHMTTIGVIAHEMAHDIGLPDLYDTDYTSDGIGVYSLMGSGSWGMASGEYEGTTPTHMDAWSKIQLGFATPVTVAAGSYSVNSIAGGYNILKITTSDPNQYFLVENRQCTGFDAGMYYYGITSGGIAVYHIDMSVTTDNDDETHKLVDLEEANQTAYGGCQLDDDNAKDLAYNNLFRAGTNTLFSYNTTPNSAMYNGTVTNISIGVPGSYSNTMTVTIALTPYHTITFYSNGGTAVESITQPAGAVIQRPADPVMTGYTFDGWYADANFTILVTWPYTIGSSNVVFNAKWLINRYTISFETNGGTSVASIALNYNTSAVKPANPIKTGFTFDGWFSDILLTNKVLWPYTVGTSDITLYAGWIINSCTVTFNLNGGTGTIPAAQTGNCGSAVVLPSQGDIARMYYNFLGWSESISDENPLSSYIIPAVNTTLYAVWGRVPVTVEAKEGSTTVLNEEKHLVLGLKAGTNSDEFKNSFINVNGDGHMDIYPVNAGKFGTGTRIDVIDNITGTVLETYFVLIFGDVNGDGNIDAMDADTCINVQDWKTNWDYETQYYNFYAGDINGDGNIDALDSDIINETTNWRMRIDQITGRASVI